MTLLPCYAAPALDGRPFASAPGAAPRIAPSTE